MLSAIAALVSYYVALLTTPSPSVSLLIWASHSPRAAAVYRVFKGFLRAVLRQGSELERILRHGEREGSIRLDKDGDGDGDGEDVPLRPKDGGGAIWKDAETVTDWRIDYAISNSRMMQLQTALPSVIEDPDKLDDVAIAIGSVKCLPTPYIAALRQRLERLQVMHAGRQQILARATKVYDKDNARHQEMLRELWTLLKPDTKLDSLSTKQWQDIGFQGKDPSTDWRSTGLLGLDALLHFARKNSNGKRAQIVVREAVEGASGWYPFAIATITITDFVLQLLRTDRLRYILLESHRGVEETFLDLTSALILHFHTMWRFLQTSEHVSEAGRPRPTVMNFETVCKRWKVEVARWLERGRIGGCHDSRGLIFEATPASAPHEERSTEGEADVDESERPLIEL